ncbi:Unknown protein, partial [Striga hermonthica]
IAARCAPLNQSPPYHDSWDYVQTWTYPYEQQWDSWPIEQSHEFLEDSSEYNAKLDQVLALLASQAAQRSNIESRIKNLVERVQVLEDRVINVSPEPTAQGESTHKNDPREAALTYDEKLDLCLARLSSHTTRDVENKLG